MAQISNEWLNELSGCPIFRRLTTEQLLRVANLVTEVAFPAGALITPAGESVPYVYVVLDGTVAFPSLTRTAKPIVVGVGSVFGHASLVPPYQLMYEGSAATDARLLAISCAQLLELLERDVVIGRRVWQGLAYEFASRFRDAAQAWRAN